MLYVWVGSVDEDEMPSQSGDIHTAVYILVD